MPTITPGAKILVSGANGFVALWLVQSLLEKGYSVRGTIRSASKADHLNKLFKEKYGAKFELVIVADITKEGAFDEAVRGVDAIAHTASPFSYTHTTPEATIDPAVKGTVGILKSALKISTIKRIIVLSSAASILEFGDKARIFTELDWNEQQPAIVKEKGADAGAVALYFTSKTYAEKAAWDFYNENKATISWDLTVLNPPYVLGPVLGEVKDAQSLNESNLEWYNAVLANDSKQNTNLADITSGRGGFIDVRDLANAHILAFEKEAAGGQRFIVSGGFYCLQEWLDLVNKLAPSIPEVPASRELPKGTPDAWKTAFRPIDFDVSKADRILGIKYLPKEKTATDMVKDYLKRGW